MAKCSVKMPEDFLLKISRLGEKTDEIVEKTLQAGAEVVEEKVRSSLRDVIGKDLKTPSRSTGQLLSALGTSRVLQDRNGNFNIKVGFDENRKDGKSNAMLANVIEYGKHGQPAKPFLMPAASKSKAACIKAMTDRLESEVGSI